MNSIAEQLIPCAACAPSGRNTQPWQFSVNQDTIRIFPDLSRRLPVVHPDIEPVIDFVREGNIVQCNDTAFVAKLVAWSTCPVRSMRFAGALWLISA